MSGKTRYDRDWKIFRERVPYWQEVYIARILKEYEELLKDESKQPSERFYALKKRIREDQKKSGVCIDDMRKSEMSLYLAILAVEGAITEADLEGISEETKRLAMRHFR